MHSRRQLTLFVPPCEGVQLEMMRTLLDPIQASLIPAHVTLCRENDIAAVATEDLKDRIRSSNARAIALQFGRPVTFQGHEVMLPCIAGEQAFHALRAEILGTPDPQRHAPHITLAHPRNPSHVDDPLGFAMKLPETISYTFASLALIEQVDSGPWRVLQEGGLR